MILVNYYQTLNFSSLKIKPIIKAALPIGDFATFLTVPVAFFNNDYLDHILVLLHHHLQILHRRILICQQIHLLVLLFYPLWGARNFFIGSLSPLSLRSLGKKLVSNSDCDNLPVSLYIFYTYILSFRPISNCLVKPIYCFNSLLLKS